VISDLNDERGENDRSRRWVYLPTVAGRPFSTGDVSIAGIPFDLEYNEIARRIVSVRVIPSALQIASMFRINATGNRNPR